MRVRAIVTSVRDTQPKEGYSPTKFVSLEGFSCMLGASCKGVPEQGREVEAVVSCRWQKGKAPLHIIESFDFAV